MKFYNYLNEDTQVEEGLQRIKEDCLPFLKDLKNNFRMLYSGRRSGAGSPKIYKRSIRKDRQPMSTFPLVHDMLNSAFHKKFGINVRSESLFCTQDKSTAELYGKLFYVFPVGGRYKFIWSDYIKDLLYPVDAYITDYFETEFDYNVPSVNLTLRDVFASHNTNNPVILNKKIVNPVEVENAIMGFIKKTIMAYKETNKIQPLNKKNEIMLIVEQVWMIDQKLISLKDFNNWLKENI